MAQSETHVASGPLDGEPYWWEYTDFRTAHLPMAANPVYVLCLVAAYLYVVLSLGPRLMENRRPFKPDRLMMVYNAVQVLLCGYLVKEAIRTCWNGRYDWFCQPFNETHTDPLDYDVAFAVWMYFVTKILDLMDTIFMVLRKNNRQITFLHVYHHAGMVLAIWFGVKFHPGGHHSLMGPLNCFVHCILYGYYLVALLEPRAKVAWWKRYITLTQLTQFVINIVHELIPFFMEDCGVDKRYSFFALTQNAFMIYLFGSFYYENFIKVPKKKGD